MSAPPASVVVVGGGTMGAGIAHLFAAVGSTVVVLEADQALADAAIGRVGASLAKAEEKGKLASAAATLARISAVTEAADLPEAELYVEAVPEDAALKAAVLRTWRGWPVRAPYWRRTRPRCRSRISLLRWSARSGSVGCTSSTRCPPAPSSNSSAIP